MENKYKYYAFLSYSHKDEEWAKWLQHEFEHYHLPATLNGNAELPNEFRPIFRDIDELSGGELKPQISSALSESANLIVICSPNSAKSRYVNEEIEEFLEIGRRRGENYMARIFPFIISGVPHSQTEEAECFPPVLSTLPTELIAGDAVKHGREHAFVKILAGTLKSAHVDFNMLWDRFERDRIKEERRKREERDRLLIVESRYLSEKSLALTENGNSYLARMLALEALPKNLSEPERPYSPEAEFALRKAVDSQSFVCTTDADNLRFVKFSYDGKYVMAAGEPFIYIWEVESGTLINKIQNNWCSFFCDIDPKRMRIVANTWKKDKTLAVWDVKTAKIIKIFNTEYNQALFSEDGRYLAMYHSKGFIDIRDAETFKRVKRISTRSTGFAGGEYFRFAENNRDIVCAIKRKDVFEYEISSGKTVFEYYYAEMYKRERKKGAKESKAESYYYLQSPSKLVDSLINWMTFSFVIALSDDMKYIASAHSGKAVNDDRSESEIDVYDIATGRLIVTLKGHVDAVRSVGWSKDGRFIVSASNDKEVRVWNLSEYMPVKTNRKHRMLISDIFFNKTGGYVKTVSYNDSVIVWNVKTGEKVNDENILEKLEPSFAVGNSKLKIIEPRGDEYGRFLEYRRTEKSDTLRFEEERPFRIWEAVISKDRTLIAIGNDCGVVKILDGKTLTLIKELNLIYDTEEKKRFVIECDDFELGDWVSPVTHLEFNKDGSKLLTLWRNGRCCVWDVATGAYERYPQPDMWLHSAQFTRDGNRVIAVGRDYFPNYLILWDYKTGEEIRKSVEVGDLYDNLDRYRPAVHGVMSPNKSKLAVAVNDYVRFFNPDTLEEVKFLRAHDCKVINLFFTEDDAFVVSQSEDGRVCVWDAEEMLQKDVFEPIPYMDDNQHYFIEYEEKAYSYFKKVRLIKLSGYWKGEKEWVSPSGRFIAREDNAFRNNEDNVVHDVAIYDEPSGLKICSFRGEGSAVTVVTFSKDEQTIAASFADGKVKIWKFPPLQQLIDETSARFRRRSFTPEEIKRYYLSPRKEE